MDIAYEVATWLGRMGFGTVGTDIFAGQIPDSQNGIFVVRAGGQPNKYVPIEEAVVDVYVKNTKASTCIQTLENIKRAIHRMHTTELNDAYVYVFLVIGDIEDVMRDLEYAKIFKVTVQVLHRDTNLIS